MIPHQGIGDPDQIVNSVFGFPSFRPGQLPIIKALLNHQDVLALLPTGGGKSLCFQVPAVCLPGLTLVISPLLSLMADQVQALTQKQIPAAYLSSQQSIPEQNFILRQAIAGAYKLLYLAPERLNNVRFSQVFHQLPISMLILDEAHCLSEWGHDFRPSYRSISSYFSTLKHRPVIGAFTATATPETQADIITTLNLNQPQIFKQSFLRTNIKVETTYCPTSTHKLMAIGRELRQHWGEASIIYCSSRETTEQLALFLESTLYEKTPGMVAAFHAGLSTDSKNQIQDRFLKNDLQVLVATTAFGMGIDKPNVRLVIHYHLPPSIENYYQEIGRAGRDRGPSQARLLFSPPDLELQLEMIAQSHQRPQKQKKVAAMVKMAETRRCRQQVIMEYFGELMLQTCGNCDNCISPKYRSSEDEVSLFHRLQATRHWLRKNRPEPWQDIMSDRVLKILSVYKPQTATAWQAIPGLGSYIVSQPDVIHAFSQCYKP